MVIRIVAFIGVLTCGAATVLAGTSRQSAWDGVYTTAQARQGAELYATHCATCHGETLSGGESVPALTGVAFNATWESVPLGDLFERMRSSMPPGKIGTVSRQGFADILAYMLRVSGMPAGSAALSADKTALGQIRFLSNRP